MNKEKEKAHRTPKNIHEKGYFEAFLWAMAFFTVFAVVTLKMTDRYWSKSVQYGVDRDMALLDIFGETKDRADVSLVLLGTSRLRHAVTFGFDPQDTIRLSNGQSLAALQFGIDAGSYQNFAHLQTKVLDINPDYLVIQRNLLSGNSFEDNALTLYWMFMSVSNYIERVWLDRMSLEEAWRHDRQYVDSSCIEDFTAKRLAERIDLGRRRGTHDLQGSGAIAFRAFVTEAVARGIRVIILDVPPNIAKMRDFDSAQHELDTGELGHYLQEDELLPENKDKVSWLYYDSSGKDNVYCDYVHLNEGGRQEFSTWLLDEFTNIQPNNI